jgi:hypothetical protein
MKKLQRLAVLLSFLIFTLPFLSYAADQVDLKAEILKFDISTLPQYAGNDWQTDPNSSANILKQDQKDMEKSWKTRDTYDPGNTDTDTSYNNTPDKDPEIGDILMASGCVLGIAAVIIIPLALLLK